MGEVISLIYRIVTPYKSSEMVKKSGSQKTERKFLATRCGTNLPVPAINRYMKQQGFRLPKNCLAYLSGFLDYMHAEINELSQSVDKKHVAMAITTDEELQYCFKNVEFLGVGHVGFSSSHYNTKSAPKTAKASQQ